MLSASGAKLMDFGLAKPAAAVLGTDASLEAGPLTPSTPTMNLSAAKRAGRSADPKGNRRRHIPVHGAGGLARERGRCPQRSLQPGLACCTRC